MRSSVSGSVVSSSRTEAAPARAGRAQLIEALDARLDRRAVAVAGHDPRRARRRGTLEGVLVLAQARPRVLDEPHARALDRRPRGDEVLDERAPKPSSSATSCLAPRT
jgi:hypothetical protein